MLTLNIRPRLNPWQCQVLVAVLFFEGLIPIDNLTYPYHELQQLEVYGGNSLRLVR